tara:strand:+ start:442 stop:1647 length:1206 start_codon:yes stop_codon:yes gene_type:complete
LEIKLIKPFYKINKLYFFRALLIILFILVFFFSKFPLFLKGLHLPDVYPFLDLKGRLAHIQANRLGFDTYSIRNPFDPLGRINNKPSISLIFSITGLNVNDAIWLGNILISFFLLQTISLLRETKLIFLILGGLCIFNPNILFAIERCNDDIIVFLFCFLVPYLISKNYIFNSIAIFIVWFLTALKYYPIVLNLFFISKNIPKLKKYLFLIVGLNISWLIFSFKEILFIKKRLPNSDANLYSFSLEDLFEFANTPYILSICLFLISIFFGYSFLKSEKEVILKRLSKVNELDKRYFILGTTMLTFCYLVSFNWSYRLIHSIFLLPIILNLLSNTNLKSLKFRYERFLYLIIISLVFSNWASIISMELVLKLKIVFNFLFFSTSSAFGIFIFQDLNLKKCKI